VLHIVQSVWRVVTLILYSDGYALSRILIVTMNDSVCGAVVMALPLREFTRFIWWM